jgi:GNAT superfamily N-acetyltransferase
VIRLARPDERAALEDLQRRASLVHEDHREDLLAHPDAIELPAKQIEGGYVLVCEVEGDLAGFVVVLPRADGLAELDGLFVDPPRWRGGLGRRLVEAGCELALSFGASGLHVVANPNALDFYRACGFVDHGMAETRFGPAQTMLKPIRTVFSP